MLACDCTGIFQEISDMYTSSFLGRLSDMSEIYKHHSITVALSIIEAKLDIKANDIYNTSSPHMIQNLSTVYMECIYSSVSVSYTNIQATLNAHQHDNQNKDLQVSLHHILSRSQKNIIYVYPILF